MERDFLGVGGRNYRASLMEESLAGGLLDSVNSAVHCPFKNKPSALQTFMPFEASAEDKRKKLLFELLSSTRLQPASSIDAFEESNTACSVKAPEKLLGLECHGAAQFSNHSQTADTRRASSRRSEDASFTAMSQSSIPIAMTSPFLKSPNCPNPTATARKQQAFGSFTQGDASKPRMNNALLTIFYGGSVNVYDDVPSHMAQAIMLMASKECKAAINSGHIVSDGLNSNAQTLNNATIMPRAVPQARKASLARFLEKRKERLSNMMPYSCEKKSPDGSTVLEGAPLSSKCSSADASISSNRCGSWYVGQTKSCSDSDKFPSTKLKM